MTAGSVRGIDIHDNRIKEFSHSNPDIDFSRTENNYKLKETENSFYNSVQGRIKELDLPKAVRKDAVVMSQALVTSDKAFFDGISKEQQEDFFKKSYEFIENRYGKENIISATVHLDEKTPHMHVNFVPVTSDGRLCAKDLLNRKEMQNLQNDAYSEVFKLFGLERGETKEEKRRHLSTEEFKLYKKQEELDVKEKIVKISQNKLNKLDSDLVMRESRLGQKEKRLDEKEKNINLKEHELNTKENTLKEAVGRLNSHFNVYRDLNAIKIKKEILGGDFKITGTEEDLQVILNLAKKGLAHPHLNAEVKELNEKISDMNYDFRHKEKRLVELLSEKSDLKARNDSLFRDFKETHEELKTAKDILKENGLDKVFENALLQQLQLVKQVAKKAFELEL